MYQTQPSWSLTIVFIMSWKVSVALVNPNGICIYSKSLFLVRKDVFHSCPAATLIRLHTHLRSSLVHHLTPQVMSSSSLMSGSAYLFGMERRLSSSEATTSLRDLYLLRADRIGSPVAEREGRTLAVCRFSSRCFCNPSSSAYVVLQTAPLRIFSCASYSGIS